MGEITVTREIDGETREIVLDTDELGVIPRDEVESRYAPRAQLEAERRKAARQAREEARSQLLEDDDFLASAATEREDFFRERFGGEPNDAPDVDKIREQILRDEAEPLKKELQGAHEEIQGLRRSRLRGEIAEICADLPVREHMREPLAALYRERVKWSDEYGGWFMVDDDGEFVYASNPEESGKPYKTIREDFEQKFRSGDYEGSWFDENGRPGADVGSPASGGSRGGRVTLEAFKKMSATERRQLKADNPDRWRELNNERHNEGMAALTETGTGL